MQTQVKTKITTKIAVGVAIGGITIAAFGIAVSFKQGKKTSTTNREDVQTEIGLNIYSAEALNEFINSYISKVSYSNESEMEHTEVYNETAYAREKKEKIEYTVRVHLEEGTIKTVVESGDVNVSFGENAELILKLNMSKTKVDAKLDIDAFAGRITLLQASPDISIKGISATASTYFDVNEEKPKLKNLSIDSVNIDDFDFDWDDQNWWQNAKIKFALKMECGDGQAFNSEEGNVKDKLEACMAKMVEKSLKNNKDIKKDINEAFLNAVEEGFYLQADINSSDVPFTNITSTLKELSTEPTNTDSGAPSGIYSEIASTLTPSYSANTCGSKVTIGSTSSSLSRRSYTNSEMDTSIPFDFLETVVAHNLRAGKVCPDPIPIKLSTIDAEMKISPKDSPSIEPAEYQALVLRGPKGGKRINYETDMETRNGIGMTLPVDIKITGSLAGSRVNENTEGVLNIVGEITMDDNNAMGFTIRNVILEDVAMTTNMQQVVDKQDLLDLANTFFARDYWYKMIYESGFKICPLELAHEVETVYTTDCPNCTFPLGFKVGSLAEYDIQLYSDINVDTVFNTDSVTIAITRNEIDNLCDEWQIMVNKLPNARIQEMIDGGILSEQINQMSIWIAQTNIVEIMAQMEALTTSKSKKIPMDAYPWSY